jgi:DNA-binding transcriptional MerR regulator/methylmalonyl-CoA mutase cobalamin-binding subunit
MYSIKAIASLTGLGAETLRAWERRYQTVSPRRDDGGRRLYTQQDLDRLIVLAQLSRQGHAISKLSSLGMEELQNLQQNNEEKNADNQQDFVLQIVSALCDYRIMHCEMLLKRALMAKEPLAYLRDILIPALQKVGELWHAQKISIAQEHLFSACVKRILLGMVNNYQSYSSNRPSMVFATLSGEPHEFGVLMCCLLASEQDYHSYYLGTNVPATDLFAASQQLGAEVIVLSLTQYPVPTQTLEELKILMTKTASQKMEIWVGGAAIHYWQAERKSLLKNCKIILDMDDFTLKVKHRRLA